ncbi:hypothetical protein [Thermocatellispora tengchongensis]
MAPGDGVAGPVARWASVGAGAGGGLVAGVLVGALMEHQGMVAGRAGAPAWVAFGVLGVVVGAAMGPLHGHRAPGAAVAVPGGMTAGLLGWMVWFLTGEPLLRGEAPEWSAEAAGRAYRELVGCLLSGG